MDGVVSKALKGDKPYASDVGRVQAVVKTLESNLQARGRGVGGGAPCVRARARGAAPPPASSSHTRRRAHASCPSPGPRAAAPRPAPCMQPALMMAKMDEAEKLTKWVTTALFI